MREGKRIQHDKRGHRQSRDSELTQEAKSQDDAEHSSSLERKVRHRLAKKIPTC